MQFEHLQKSQCIYDIYITKHQSINPEIKSMIYRIGYVAKYVPLLGVIMQFN